MDAFGAVCEGTDHPAQRRTLRAALQEDEDAAYGAVPPHEMTNHAFRLDAVIHVAPARSGGSVCKHIFFVSSRRVQQTVLGVGLLGA